MKQGTLEETGTAVELATAADRAIVAGKSYAVMEGGTHELLNALADNLGGDALQWSNLTRIKVPAGGATLWEVPTLGGVDGAKEVEGVIVLWKMIRSYWEGRDPAQGTPPDCTSADMVTGTGTFGPGSEGNPSGRCDRCPMAQFGSAVDAKGEPGPGQACKQKRLLFMLRPDDRLPVVVAIPPGSLKPVKQYFLQLAQYGMSYYTVATRLKLTKATSQSGITYAQVVPEMAGQLTPEQVAIAKGYNDELRPVIEGVVYDTEAWEDEA
ncbi:MAG: hypothetical protein AB7R89_05990 [Dehalococcoidia bacterium]